MPEEQGPQQPQFRLEDIFNVGEIRQQLGSLFKDTFKDVESAGKTAFDGVISAAKGASETVLKVVEKQKKEEEKIRAEFDKKRLSAEEFKVKQLLKQRDDLLKKIKGVHVQELNNLRGMIKDKTKLSEAETRKRKEHAKELKDFSVKMEKGILSARVSAGAATPLQKLQQSMNSLTDKTKGYARSLLQTKTWWEAIVVVLADAAGQTARITEAQSALRAAGLAGTGGRLVRGIAGGTGGGELGRIAIDAMGRLQNELQLTAGDMAQLIQTLASAPQALKEVRDTGGESLNTFVAGMGRFGIQVEESMSIVSSTSNTFGMTLKNLNDVMNTAESITRDTGINFRDAFQSLVRLTGQMRTLTFNADAAQQIFLSTVGTLTQMRFAPQEIQRFNEAIAQVLGQMSPTALAGLVAFGQGAAPTGLAGRQQLLAAAEGAPQTLVDFFKPVLATFEKGSAERLFATQKLAEKIGLGAATTVKGSQAFERIVDEFGENPEEMKAAFEKFKQEFKPPAEIELEGFKALRDMRNPLINLEKTFRSFLNSISGPLTTVFKGLNDLMPKIRTVINWAANRLGGPTFEPLNPTEARFQQQFRAAQPTIVRRARSQKLIESDQWKPM